MARVRFTDLQARPTEFLDMPSRTLDEFQPLVAPFETACQAPRAAGRRDGPPRTARRLPVSQHWPIPPPAERLLLSLVSGKTSALHVVQGQLFRMRQRTATPWMPGLLPVLLAPRRPLGDAPARSLTALAQRRGGAAADVATGVIPVEEERTPLVAAPAGGPASPLVPMTARHGASSAPKTLRHSPRVRAASNKPPRANMSCSSMPCSRSSASARPLQGGCTISVSPWPRPPPSLPGGGGDRIGASSRARFPRSRS